MLTTPFGSICITIDDREIEYVAVKLPLGRHFYSGATGRYAIRIDLVPDGAEHNIDCRLIEIPSNVEGWSNSGEDIEDSVKIFWEHEILSVIWGPFMR